MNTFLESEEELKIKLKRLCEIHDLLNEALKLFKEYENDYLREDE